MVRQASEILSETQPQVFVSYARQDAEKVLEIARLLEQQGATVWRDGDHILGGQYYGEEIVHAIAHSRVVMLMCSPQAFHSDNVHREVLLTWDYYHRRYIPVWLGPVADIPDRFRYCLVGCQWIDAHSQPPERWLPQLLKAFKALGVETKNPADQSAESTPSTDNAADVTDRPGLRFHPGDKPIRAADWELERLLGKGGFGEVWKAHNPDLPGLPPVALKFCLQLDARSRDLLRHEANMVLRAQQQIRSDGIVPLLHAYLNNDPPCLEYPYVEGGTLVRLLDECRQSAGSFTPAQVQRIIQRIAQIVGPAHRATPRLVHRDLKPSNIMVERRVEGKLVLRVTDFGIGAIAAQAVLEHSRSSSSLEGNLASVLTGAYSPLYASPQQMRGDKADPRDDVYALGVIWYQLLKGDLANPAPTGRKWINALRSRGMGDEAIELLSSCFETDPADRPSDGGMLAELLQSLPTPNSAKDVAPKSELPVVELGPSPSLEPTSPRPESEAKAAPPPASKPASLALKVPAEMGPPAQPVLNVTREELDRDAPSPPPTLRLTGVPAPHRSRHNLEPSARRRGLGAFPFAYEGPRKTGSSRRARPAGGCLPELVSTPTTVGRPKVPGHWLAAGVLGLIGFFGIVIFVTTDNGTVKITGTDSKMKVHIDGQNFEIKNLGEPITFRTGPHKLLVTRDGLEVKTDTFRIRRGEEIVLDVTYTPKVREIVENDSVNRKTEGTSPPKLTVEPEKVAAKTPTPAPSDSPSITTRVGQIKLKYVLADTFLMGSPDGEGESDEHPQHEVRISRPFYLGIYEVTQAQYQAVIGQNPSYFSRTGTGKDVVASQSTDQHPVENVTWLDAVKFCNALSEKEGLSPFYAIDGETVRVPDWQATGYRLPTEAEWEYACRAKSTTKYSFGDDPKELEEYAWYDGNSKINSGYSTHPVGQKRANAFGLFDMHGNVWEWCWDIYGGDYYKTSTHIDPKGLDASIDRVLRGGSYGLNPANLRASGRHRLGPGVRGRFVGFRLARTYN